MGDEAEFTAVRDALFQPATGVYIAPIRHHSPACAWAVQQMIRELKPKTILVEAPYDFNHIIPHLVNPATVPPVAIAGLLDQKDGPRLSAHYPFCEHSPELVALKEGAKIKARLEFIDQTSGAKIQGHTGKENAPRSLIDEMRFNSSDYVAALANKLGCRDGFELWDHLFETRLGAADWRSFLMDVGSYCAGLRALTPQSALTESGDLDREDFMAKRIANARTKGGPIVVVIGGFHAPALVMGSAKKSSVDARGKTTVQSYLIRYGYKELDAINGYAAGLPQPAYYENLWQGAKQADGSPDWCCVAQDLVQRFAADMRNKGHTIPITAMVELLRSADALSKLRGRPGVMRHDLIDGLKSALLKGETAGQDVWSERFIGFLRGHAIGDVCEDAGQPPIVEDARRRAKALRYDISDGRQRERSLDTRRKPKHLSASQFAHSMALLDTGFASRDAGPDFMNSVQTGLLFEHWNYAWSPQVEGMLIEAAMHGDTVPQACTGVLMAWRRALIEGGLGNDLSALIGLFKQGLLAGIGTEIADLVMEIEQAIRTSADFEHAAMAMKELHAIETSRGPLGVPDGLDIIPAMNAAYERVIYLCDDLPDTSVEAVLPKLGALRLVADFLRSEGADAFGYERFETALDRVVDANPPAEILGAVLVIGLQSGRRTPDELCRAMRGQFQGSFVSSESKVGILRGMLEISATVLWSVDNLLEEMDGFLTELGDAEFLELLPHLRLAFTRLSPRQTDQLADVLARKLGGAVTDFTAHQFDISKDEVAHGALIEARLLDSLDKDGLTGWVSRVGAGN